MKFILGRKLNMTQIFDAGGAAIPVTAISVRSNIVTQVRTRGKDGYEALQVGEGSRNQKNINKAQKGHFKDLGNFTSVREVRVDAPTLKVGDKFELSQFTAGDEVTVSGVSKGKGFQGVVKRHGFGGGPRSHGQKHSEREPGSIGSTGQQKVSMGTRMAGRMGGDTITVRGLKVLAVDSTNNLLLVSGAITGRRGTLIEIKALNS